MRVRPARTWLTPAARKARGDWAEGFVATHLERAGLVVVARNHRCRRGELDLVARDGDTLVFVEVRYRARQDFGGALESIDEHKAARLVAAAEHFMATRRIDPDVPSRFDVVCLSGRPDRPRLQWIRDAFGP